MLEFIHVRCSEQFNNFSSNCNEIHLLIGASLMINIVFLSSPLYTTNWLSFSDKSWRFCLIFPICIVYSIWKPNYLIQFDSIAHAIFLSISPTKKSYELPFTISTPTHHKATHPQVNWQPLCQWWLFHFQRALSGSKLARFLILKIWFVGYLKFLVATTSTSNLSANILAPLSRNERLNHPHLWTALD